MSRFLLIAFCAGLAACGSNAPVSVTTRDGTSITLGRGYKVGGRGGGAISADGIKVVHYDNYDDSFREGNKTVRRGLDWWGARGVASTLGDAFSGAYRQSQMTERAARAAKVEETRILTEAETARVLAEQPLP